MQNYILIRVTEDDTQGSTKAGFLRRKLHELAREHNIKLADNLIREDREYLPNGSKVPYEEVSDLFNKIIRI